MTKGGKKETPREVGGGGGRGWGEQGSGDGAVGGVGGGPDYNKGYSVFYSKAFLV